MAGRFAGGSVPHRTSLSFALVIAAASAAAAAAPLPAQFEVSGVVSSGAAVNTIPKADSLFAGTMAGAAPMSATSSTINFDDPENPGKGFHFGGKVPFIINTAANDTNFGIDAKGLVTIPGPGVWTFGVNSDDGFSLQVGTFSFHRGGIRLPANTIRSFTFDHAGTYSIDLMYYQHMGHAEVELFASPGKFRRFHQNGADFQLVGDTGNGGLALAAAPGATPTPQVGSADPISVPEPTGVTALVISFGALLARRRRCLSVGRC
jgi:hypothetical protein